MISRSSIKKAVDKVAGFTLLRSSTLPMGVDFKTDVKRFHLEKGSIVFDIGANVGQSAKEYASLFPKARIYSFEPVHATFQTLKNNTESLDRVYPVNLGFGEKEEEVEIVLNEDPTSVTNSLNVGLRNRSAHAPRENIMIRTVDRYCEDNRIDSIDFMKIDTEGWEMQTLKGAKTMIEQNRINALFCEVGFSQRNKRHTHLLEVLSFLSSHGYSLLGISDTNYKRVLKKTHYGDRLIHYGNALFISEKYVDSLGQMP